MSTATIQHSLFDRDGLSRVARAGVLTGITDGLFSSVLSVAFYHSTVQRLFQGVASTLLGPFIWMVMSLAVIPLLLQRPPAINIRWLVQLIGHIPFVGIPIVASIGRGAPRSEGR